MVTREQVILGFRLLLNRLPDETGWQSEGAASVFPQVSLTFVSVRLASAEPGHV
jgi:hypothetical protein